MKKEIITIAILFFVFAAVLIFLDLPSYNKFTYLKDEIEEYKASIKEKEELVARVSQLQEIYNSREDAADKVFYVLPAEKDIPGLIVQFEALVSENGLILENIDFKKEKTEESIIDIHLQIKGSYVAFKSFLEALELNVRIMNIKAIDFSSQKTEEGDVAFEFDIKLITYYQ